MRIVICGLSITSSWGNGHATTYRGLVQGLARRGHDVLFLEREKPWYAAHRDMQSLPSATVQLYDSLDELRRQYRYEVENADFVMVGSFVPEGVAVAEWVLGTARGVVGFYDIDTPVTLGKLRARDKEYLSEDLIPYFDLYLSFTGGPTLTLLEREYGARSALPLYCAVDPAIYYPQFCPLEWDLGYLGTYSDDRQPALEHLILEPARHARERRYVVAGSLYPEELVWPDNVKRIEHLPAAAHRSFYNAQRFTLNVTRQQMIAAGYSPSVRLFEAAACAVPVISDYWKGLEEFLEPGKEILIARNTEDTLDYLKRINDAEARCIGGRARSRILSEHTADCRSQQLENYVHELTGQDTELFALSASSAFETVAAGTMLDKWQLGCSESVTTAEISVAGGTREKASKPDKWNVEIRERKNIAQHNGFGTVQSTGKAQSERKNVRKKDHRPQS